MKTVSCALCASKLNKTKTFLLINQWKCHFSCFITHAMEGMLFKNPFFPPSPAQQLFAAGGSSRGRGGCSPCQNGGGSRSPLCPVEPSVYPPLDEVTPQPVGVYAARGRSGVPPCCRPARPPKLKSSGWRKMMRVSDIYLFCELFSLNLTQPLCPFNEQKRGEKPHI